MRETVSLEKIRASVGGAATYSDWLVIDQAMIDAFARLTGDNSYIHVDPQRAQRTRFKGTIAHGLLVLSVLPQLMWTATPIIEGTKMGVNYGYDRVRFIAPTPVDSRIRARFLLAEVAEPKPRFIRLTYDVTVEIEGAEEPALAASWLLGRWLEK